MLRIISMVEGTVPIKRTTHLCEFVSLSSQIRACRSFKTRKAAIKFMWRTIGDVAQGKHDDDIYGAIVNQKIFAVELTSSDGNFASLLFAYVNSEDEAQEIRDDLRGIIKQVTQTFSDVDQF